MLGKRQVLIDNKYKGMKLKTIEKMVKDTFNLSIIAGDLYSYKVAEVCEGKVYEYDIVHNGLDERKFLIDLYDNRINSFEMQI